MKIIITLAILGLLVSNVKAQPVDIKLAEKVAENYFQRNVHDSIRSKYCQNLQKECGSKLKVKKSVLKTYNGKPSYYINNMEGGGWVLVSADKKTGPVIAYSEFGSYDLDNLPQVITDWMAQYDPIIEHRREKDTVIVGKAEKWAKYENDNMLKSGGLYPNFLIQTTWHQAAPYNDKVTEVIDHNVGTTIDMGDKCLAGCSSIAMAQIVNYWGFSQGDKADYEFWHMPNSLSNSSTPTEQQRIEIDATSYMIRTLGKDKLLGDYCYTDLQTRVTKSTGIAFTEIGYPEPDELDFGFWTTYNGWLEEIIDCINQRMPLIYIYLGKHEFVCDGYRSENDNLHFNLGWDPTEGGYTTDGPNLLWSDFEDLKGTKLSGAWDYSDKYQHRVYAYIQPAIDYSKELTGITVNNAENKTWQVYNNLSVKSLVVNSGAKSQLVAGTSVSLQPGFWAQPGSKLMAKAYMNDNLYYATLKSARINKDQLNPQIQPINPELNSVKVFPNPAFGKITIETSTAGNGTYQLFDLMGKNMLSGSINSTSTQVSLDNIPTGTYVLKMVYNTKTYRFKIIHY